VKLHQTHPLHVRVTHWINAVVVLVMLWSGFAMFAGDRHFAGVVHRVPLAIWQWLQLAGHGVQGRAWHLGMAIVFIANALAYGVSSLGSRSWRRIVPAGAWLRDAWKAIVDELTRPAAALERSEYNAAQRLAYTLVVAGGMLMILTGLALWFGKRISWLVALLGGERVVIAIHLVVATALLAFIALHVAQVLRAGVPTLLGMITGTTAPRPARARRGFAWTATVIASLVAAFRIMNATSGPSGVPVFLRWAVPAHAHHDSVANSPRRHRRSHEEAPT
jgi:thiosulfate reductase cytochrome b subunit